MSFLIAILLGIVQGITEFLPVSSSGHLLILEKLLGVKIDAAFLNVLLHFATLLAVLFWYRKTIFYMLKHPLCKLNKYLLLATIPAIVFVVLTKSIFGDFMSSSFVGIGFLVSAIFLAVSQIFVQKNKAPEPLNLKGVLTMGFAQSFAVFPGISRSGTTFSFGVISGLEKTTALDFSFLMSIPIIFASMVYELCFSGFSVSADFLSCSLSFVSAFLTAILGIGIMQKLVKKISFWWFSIYLIVVGVLIIALF